MIGTLCLVVSLVGTLAGCALLSGNGSGGARGRANVESAPDWFMNPPVSDDALHATGEGVMAREAEKAARSGLAAQIRSEVSSRTRDMQESEGRYQREIFRQTTEQTVSDVPLVGARVVEQARVGRTFYVLMRLEKSAIIREQANEVAADLRALEDLLDLHRAVSFDTWWKLIEARPTARRLGGNVSLLAAFDVDRGGGATAEAQGLLSRYADALAACRTAKRLSIRDESGVRGAREALATQLERENIRVEGGRGRAWLAVSTDYESERIGSETYVAGTLWIRLRSSRGGLLGEISIPAKAVSLSGESDGRRRVQAKLIKKLRKSFGRETLIAQLIGST